MAMSSVWITVVSILAMFDITKAVGDDGQEIEPTYEYSSDFVRYVLCAIPYEQVLLIMFAVRHSRSNVQFVRDPETRRRLSMLQLTRIIVFNLFSLCPPIVFVRQYFSAIIRSR